MFVEKPQEIDHVSWSAQMTPACWLGCADLKMHIDSHLEHIFPVIWTAECCVLTCQGRNDSCIYIFFSKVLSVDMNYLKERREGFGLAEGWEETGREGASRGTRRGRGAVGENACIPKTTCSACHCHSRSCYD